MRLVIALSLVVLAKATEKPAEPLPRKWRGLRRVHTVSTGASSDGKKGTGMHWTHKQAGQARVGEELQRRGWTLFGYRAGEADGRTDYFRPPSWEGVATNADYPGIVVGVAVSGRRMSGKERDGVTWPRYLETPKGVAWHMQQDDGTRCLKTGKGLARCGGYTDTDWKPAVMAMCDAIERAAADASGVARPARTAAAETQENRASADGITVTCTVERDWTWVGIEPRISREAYERFKTRFGARWSKRRQQVYVTRHVTPAEILAFLRPGEQMVRAPGTVPEPDQAEVAPRPDPMASPKPAVLEPAAPVLEAAKEQAEGTADAHLALFSLRGKP